MASKSLCGEVLHGVKNKPTGICGWSLLQIIKVFVLFIPCVVASGFLYFRVILSLAQGRVSPRKRCLSVVLITLWTSWVLMILPFLVFELVADWLGKIEWRPARIDQLINYNFLTVSCYLVR